MPEGISVICIDNWCNHCLRANRIGIVLDVTIRQESICMYLTGNIGIVVQVILQQIFFLFPVDDIIRFCIGKGLDTEVVERSILNGGVLFRLLCQLSSCHCLFGIVFFFCKNLYNIALCGCIIVDCCIIQSCLIGQFRGGVLLIQLPFQLFRLILCVVNGKTRTICCHRNNAIWQNVRNNRKRKCSLLTAVCSIAMQCLFIVITIRSSRTTITICIPIIVVLYMNIEPVYFSLGFCIVLLYCLSVHFCFICTDCFTNGCPAANQWLTLHGSCSSFCVEDSGTLTIPIYLLIVGEVITVFISDHFLILDVVSIYRRRIGRSCQIF